MGAAVGGAARRHGPRHVGPRPGTGLSEEQLDVARDMRDRGVSYRKIGLHLGVSCHTVEYNLTIKHRRAREPISLAAADRPEGHPIDAALAALGGRATVSQQRATLDGRPASLVQVVQAANDTLAAAGRAPIVYPGVRGGRRS